MTREYHARILAELKANRGYLENMETRDLEEAQDGWHDHWYISLYESRNSLFSPDFDLHSDIAFELDRRKIEKVRRTRERVKNKMKGFYR